MHKFQVIIAAWKPQVTTANQASEHIRAEISLQKFNNLLGSALTSVFAKGFRHPIPESSCDAYSDAGTPSPSFPVCTLVRVPTGACLSALLLAMTALAAVRFAGNSSWPALPRTEHPGVGCRYPRVKMGAADCHAPPGHCTHAMLRIPSH